MGQWWATPILKCYKRKSSRRQPAGWLLNRLAAAYAVLKRCREGQDKRSEDLRENVKNSRGHKSKELDSAGPEGGHCVLYIGL